MGCVLGEGQNWSEMRAGMHKRIDQLLHHENLILPILAVVVGILGGVVALGFRELIDLGHLLLYQSHAENLLDKIPTLQWWHLLLAPCLGGLVVGFINVRYLNGGRGQGVADIIERNALHGSEFPWKKSMWSALASSLSIGSGASVGREGPILHLTSSISALTAGWFKLDKQHRHTLLGCAAASALAASFNAPIAGVFFALEVVLRHYALNAFTPVVISSVIGTMITRSIYGDFPAYILPNYPIVTYWEFPAFIILGLVSGLAAILFMRSVFIAEDLIGKIKIPKWSKPAIGGLIVGMIALAYPQVLGVGYGTTNMALNENLTGGIIFLLVLIVGKTIATAISIGAGFGGGVFSPSLFIGAVVGCAFGTIASSIAPELGIHIGLYAIIGMAATSSAVLGAPISTILIIFELLGDFNITIGVMSGAAIASLLVHTVLGQSYYMWSLMRKGVKLHGNRAMQILQHQTVGDVINSGFESVRATASLPEVIDFLHTLPEDTVVVVIDDEEKFLGTICLNDVKDVAFDPLANQDAIEAQAFTFLYPVVLTTDHSLAHAITIMEKWNMEKMPVVENEENMITVGLTDKSSLLKAHVEALLQAEAESHGTSSDKKSKA